MELDRHWSIGVMVFFINFKALNFLLEIRHLFSLTFFWNLLIHVNVFDLLIILLAFRISRFWLLFINAVVGIKVLRFVEVGICLEFGWNSFALVKALEENFRSARVLLALQLGQLLLELCAIAVQGNSPFFKLWPLRSILPFARYLSS